LCKKVKIIQLFPEYVPSKLGFIEEYLFAMASCCARHGFLLTAVFPELPADFVQEKFDEKKVKVNVLAFRCVKDVFQNIKTLISKIKNENINIADVHFGDDLIIFILTAILRFYFRNKLYLVKHQHNTYGLGGKLVFIKKRISRLSLSCIFFNKIIAVSKTVKNDLISHGINANKIELIYNGINISKYQYSKAQAEALIKELDMPSGFRIVSTIAYACPMKGLRYFIAAVPIVLEKIPKVRFLIVGGGPLTDSLKKQARDLKVIDNMLFLGVRNDVPAILSLSDILVLSSVSSEGLPTVILESLCAGKAFVATDLDQCKEIITHRQNGLLVKTADERMLAQAVVSLLIDYKLASELAENGRATVKQKFSIQRMITQTIELYDSLGKG